MDEDAVEDAVGAARHEIPQVRAGDRVGAMAGPRSTPPLDVETQSTEVEKLSTEAEMRATFASRSKPSAHEAAETRCRRLFEAAQDGILVVDGVTRRIIDVNPALESLFGYARADLIGRAPWNIGPVDGNAAGNDAMHELVSQDRVRFDDLSFTTKTGRRVEVELIGSAYLVAGVRTIQCNLRDVTSRKLAEHALLARNDELRTRHDELALRDGQMVRLSRMNALLHSCATLDEAHGVFAGEAAGVFAGLNGFLATFHSEDDRLEVVAGWGDSAVGAVEFLRGDCWALRRGQPHEVEDYRTGLVCPLTQIQTIFAELQTAHGLVVTGLAAPGLDAVLAPDLTDTANRLVAASGCLAAQAIALGESPTKSAVARRAARFLSRARRNQRIASRLEHASLSDVGLRRFRRLGRHAIARNAKAFRSAAACWRVLHPEAR